MFSSNIITVITNGVHVRIKVERTSEGGKLYISTELIHYQGGCSNFGCSNIINSFQFCFSTKTWCSNPKPPPSIKPEAGLNIKPGYPTSVLRRGVSNGVIWRSHGHVYAPCGLLAQGYTVTQPVRFQTGIHAGKFAVLVNTTAEPANQMFKTSPAMVPKTSTIMAIGLPQQLITTKGSAALSPVSDPASWS